MRCFQQSSDELREVFEYDSSIAKKIQQEYKNSSHYSHKIKDLSFPKAFITMPSWSSIMKTLIATKIYEEKYVRSLSNEGNIYVGLSWKTKKHMFLRIWLFLMM